jgi:hypothetical protein
VLLRLADGDTPAVPDLILTNFAVEARDPRRIKALAEGHGAPARTVVDAKTETISPEEHDRRGEAADEAW